MRLADCPGDAEGSEVPPGRGGTWAYEPNLNRFLRYGGYTPRFSNALDAFDPTTGKWTRLAGEDENYPAERPGGGCRWSVQYDPKHKVVYSAAGLPNGANGIWSHDAAKKTFAALTTELPPHVTRVAFAPEHGVFVASPGLGTPRPQLDLFAQDGMRLSGRRLVGRSRRRSSRRGRRCATG